MKLEDFEANREVMYLRAWDISPEFGITVKKDSKYIFVLFDSGVNAKACAPEKLSYIEYVEE